MQLVTLRKSSAQLFVLNFAPKAKMVSKRQKKDLKNHLHLVLKETDVSEYLHDVSAKCNSIQAIIVGICERLGEQKSVSSKSFQTLEFCHHFIWERLVS